MIQKYKWYILGGILGCITLSYIVCDRTSLWGKYQYWMGEYNQAKRIMIENDKQSMGRIAKLIKENRDLMDKNEKLDMNIIKLEDAQDDKDRVIGNLNAALKKAPTDADKLTILTSMVDQWSARFDLCRKQVDELDALAFNLTTSYENQIRISGEYKSLWEQESTLRRLAETGLNLADKRIRSLNRQLKLNRVLEVALVGLSAYLVLKK